MSWNPDTYLRFDDHRTRPAAELLARVPHQTPAHVFDLGCGPGNSTALLCARWSDAAVEGVDSSEEMLETARTSGPAATWSQADIADWRCGTPPDVIFSNAALQWLGGHDALLPRLMEQLASGGVLAVQMPRNFDAPSHTLLREAVEETNNPRLIQKLRQDPVAEPKTYHRILAPHAANVDIWETVYLQVLDGDDAVLAWTRGTALVPFTSELEGAELDEFIENYRRKLATAYPREADGTTLFAFKRIFMVAHRRA